MKPHFTLSRKEKELMELFWDADQPLSREEILALAEQRSSTWKPNSIHILLNSLMEKQAVIVSGYYLNSRKLGRTYTVAVSRQDYSLIQVEMALKSAQSVLGENFKQEVLALINTIA